MSKLSITKQHYEQELGIISYLELQKFFAKGVILRADEKLNIIDVAMTLHVDDAELIQDWINNKLLERASDHHAKAWLEQHSVFKAVTVAPWVLVQEVMVSKENCAQFQKENHQ